MTKVTCHVGITLDGYCAGPEQSRENPLGRGGEAIHRWMFERADEHRAMIDEIVDAGAFIMGRHMFGPDRGGWDLDWTGWWGAEPPYHGPVFVLSHHEREPVEMEGGTTFHFVTDGIEAALARAREAAGDRNVSIAGGASTIRQYLAAGAIEELVVHIAPLLLGAGERPVDEVGGLPLTQLECGGDDLVTHIRYRVG